MGEFCADEMNNMVHPDAQFPTATPQSFAIKLIPMIQMNHAHLHQQDLAKPFSVRPYQVTNWKSNS